MPENWASKNTTKKMALNDPLANALSTIQNDVKIGKSVSKIRPSSKIIKQVLGVLKDNMYLGDVKEQEDNKGNSLAVNLIGAINKCGVIKPSYSIGKDDYEKFEKQFLLAREMGILIVSTPFGIMSHTQAKKKNTGGRLLAYCY